MNVQVNTTKQEKKSKPFPKLMSTQSGYIVFFSKSRCGMCLHKPTNSIDVIGEYYTEYSMADFTDFEGSITLSND